MNQRRNKLQSEIRKSLPKHRQVTKTKRVTKLNSRSNFSVN
jgi:hypothetical protein